MSALPLTSSHCSLAWPAKPLSAYQPAASAPSYPFPLPSTAVPSSYPAAAGTRPALAWDGSSRPSPLCGPLPPPRLHGSPAPALLAEVLQSAFRCSEPRPSVGCHEARVCELVAAAVGQSDAARLQADAQKDAAVRQWAEATQRRIDEIAQRTTPAQIQSAISDWSERLTRQLTALSGQLQRAIAATEQLDQRLLAVESGVEQLNKRIDRMAALNQTGSHSLGGSSSDATHSPPARVTRQSEQSSVASHPAASPSDASHAPDVMAGSQSAEDEDEEDETEEMDETGEDEEAADDDAIEVAQPAPAEPAGRLHGAVPSAQLSPPPASDIPWPASQPTAAARYSCRPVAAVADESAMTAAHLQQLPHSSELAVSRPVPVTPPSSSSSVASSKPRQKPRRRHEAVRLIEAAGCTWPVGSRQEQQLGMDRFRGTNSSARVDERAADSSAGAYEF